MSTNFKTTLETRRENMRAQNDRRNQFSGGGIPGDSVGLRSTVLYNDDQRAQQHDNSLIPANQFQGNIFFQFSVLQKNFLSFFLIKKMAYPDVYKICLLIRGKICYTYTDLRSGVFFTTLVIIYMYDTQVSRISGYGSQSEFCTLLA